jgi:hypothetical protein
MMLERVLTSLNNWFEAGAPIVGEFAVEGGGIVLPLLNGQYFRVLGSVFNDGLHRYPAEDMQDETFEGIVIPLAVPKAVIQLAAEIEEWETKNGDRAKSPVTSESFGGYSYAKSTGEDAQSWEKAFKRELSAWRKL